MRARPLRHQPQQGGGWRGRQHRTAPQPAWLATYRVNDYDLHIQHNEAVELACQHLGVARTRTDAFWRHAGWAAGQDRALLITH